MAVGGDTLSAGGDTEGRGYTLPKDAQHGCYDGGWLSLDQRDTLCKESTGAVQKICLPKGDGNCYR